MIHENWFIKLLKYINNNLLIEFTLYYFSINMILIDTIVNLDTLYKASLLYI